MPNPVVIKYGGSLLENTSKQIVFLDQIAREWKTKRNQIVLVHGGGKEITRQTEKAGLETKFVHGRRYTDDKTMEVVENALRQLNESFIEQMTMLGVKAVGYSGKANHWLQAVPIAELGRVGAVPDHISADKLRPLLSKTELPIFYSVGEDAAGQTLNINADDFAMALGIALGADELIFLTDTGGVLDKSGKLIPQINRVGADRLMQNETISGGMAVKIQACFQAISSGVGKVIIGEGILSDAQGLHVTNGTVIVKDGPTLEV